MCSLTQSVTGNAASLNVESAPSFGMRSLETSQLFFLSFFPSFFLTYEFKPALPHTLLHISVTPLKIQ